MGKRTVQVGVERFMRVGSNAAVHGGGNACQNTEESFLRAQGVGRHSVTVQPCHSSMPKRCGITSMGEPQGNDSMSSRWHVLDHARQLSSTSYAKALKRSGLVTPKLT